jgi:hypothetical protein
MKEQGDLIGTEREKSKRRIRQKFGEVKKV